jgi:hypothetical protein
MRSRDPSDDLDLATITVDPAKTLSNREDRLPINLMKALLSA